MSDHRPELLARHLTFKTKPLDRIHAPARGAFEEQIRGARKPVIMTGLMDAWPAMRSWSPGYLRDKLGQRQVGAYRSPDRFFPGRDQVGCDGRTSEDDGRCRRNLSASELFDRLEGLGTEIGELYYLYAFPLASAPDLIADIQIPDLAGRDVAAFLWVSAKHHVTPMHFDGNYNLLGQIFGTKHVLLFAPNNFDRLYPHGADHHYARHSQIFDLEAADLRRYPRLKEAEALHGILEPGTMLFIPNFWWHCVYTSEMSISVNFFDSAEPFSGWRERMEEWSCVVGKFFNALPSDIPDEMKSYILRTML